MRVALVAVAALALLGACGGGTTSTASPAPGQTPGPATPAGGGDTSAISCNDGGAGAPAEIFDFGFRPSPVTAGADLTVTWTNTGATIHDLTFDNGGPDCGTLASTDTLSVLFPGPGTYAYHCSIHPAMKGSVVV
jgi:plastocyanin